MGLFTFLPIDKHFALKALLISPSKKNEIEPIKWIGTSFASSNCKIWWFMNLSNPLLITVMFFLLHWNSLIIPSFELCEGEIILLILGATFFCIFKNEYHLYLEILYLNFLVAFNSNLKSKVIIIQPIITQSDIGDGPAKINLSEKLVEKAYSKERIMELYLNQIYLGEGTYGIAAASLEYFDKAVNNLNYEEAALLAALPKAPSKYNPYRNLELAKFRRDLVLKNLLDNDYICLLYTSDAADE